MERGDVCRCCRLIVILLALSELQPAYGQKRWPDERAAGPFICHADFSLRSEDGMLAEMARLQVDLGQWLEIPAPREPIHLFLTQYRTNDRQYIGKK